MIEHIFTKGTVHDRNHKESLRGFLPFPFFFILNKKIEILLFYFLQMAKKIVGEFSWRAPIFKNAAQQIDPGIS